MYQKYLDLEREQAARLRREAMEREQELTEKGLSSEYLEMVKECETYLSNIHQCAQRSVGSRRRRRRSSGWSWWFHESWKL